jgi:hypothetical protein
MTLFWKAVVERKGHCRLTHRSSSLVWHSLTALPHWFGTHSPLFLTGVHNEGKEPTLTVEILSLAFKTVNGTLVDLYQVGSWQVGEIQRHKYMG